MNSDLLTLRANFCKSQAILDSFDSLKFWFPSFFDVW